MKTFRFSALLVLSFVPTFLLSQISDTRSTRLSESVAAMVGALDANANGPLPPGREASHPFDAARMPSPRVSPTLDSGSMTLSTLPSDPRRSGDPRFTVSVSSLAAPDKARKAFSKGQQEERKGRLEAAYDHFKEAVATYPRYAIAWLELGRLQASQNSLADAEESFRQAVSCDSSLTTGYVDFAMVASQQRNWQAMAEMTDTLVQRFPESSPVYWFLNSSGYYNLGKMKEAESSILRALRLDPHRQLPQAEYLYGLILGNKKNYTAATEHISAYLRLAPNSTDSLAARQVLAAYQQRVQMADEEQH